MGEKNLTYTAPGAFKLMFVSREWKWYFLMIKIWIFASLRDCDYCAARSERERARCRFIDLMLIRRRNLIAAAPPRAAIQPSFIIARSIDLPACWYFDITPRATAQIIFPFSHFFSPFFSRLPLIPTLSSPSSSSSTAQLFIRKIRGRDPSRRDI